VNFTFFPLVYLTHDRQDFALRDMTWQKAIITPLVRQLDHMRIACARNTDYRRCAANFCIFFNLFRECLGYYITDSVYSLPAGEVIKRVTYVFLYFGNTVFAIGHTLGFSHKHNMQDERQFAILANLRTA
jgi:hypothetical protein